MQISKKYHLFSETKLRIFLYCVFIGFFLIDVPCYAQVNFQELHGSDVGMGIGARAMAMGGAYVSLADDPTAVYWNPAGLTDVKNIQIFISAETPGEFSAAAITMSPSITFLKSIDFTFGLSHIRRLRFNGDSGNGTWEGYSAHILDLSMIDVGSDFSGSINSKTCDTRISGAFVPPWNKKLSIGLNYIFLE